MIRPCGILPGEGKEGGSAGSDEVSEESRVRDSGRRVAVESDRKKGEGGAGGHRCVTWWSARA